MKYFIKKLLLLTLILISVNYTYAQDADKTVTLVVSGQGKTQDEAKQNALRSAIEQAFGTFISSKTEILNNNLVKDEIVSIANGNIQKFEIISETKVPDGNYVINIKATISVSKLTSFIENKGFEVEFKGSLFSVNLRQQNLNENSELKSVINLSITSNYFLYKSLDYSIIAEEPIRAFYHNNFKPKEDDYIIPITVKASLNSNYDLFADYFSKTIRSICMSESEIEVYKKIGKSVYVLKLEDPQKFHTINLSFRNAKSVVALQNLFIKSNRYIYNFIVITNIDTIKVKTCCYEYYNYDRNHKSSNNIKLSSPEKFELGINTWSLNYTNASYPNFSFDRSTSGDNRIRAWDVYFENIFYLRDYSILFEKNNYYTKTAEQWREFGNSSHSSFPRPELGNIYPGTYLISDNLGTIKFTKTDYFSKYYALYKENELSKITSLSVKKLY